MHTGKLEASGKSFPTKSADASRCRKPLRHPRFEWLGARYKEVSSKLLKWELQALMMIRMTATILDTVELCQPIHYFMIAFEHS
jgi:hypothetical protein